MVSMTKEERQKEIERLRARNPSLTQKQLAERLGVDPKTIQRDMQEMRADKRLLKEEIPRNTDMRDEMFERITSTLDEVNSTVIEARKMSRMLQEQIEQARNAGQECPTCGRKGWQVNALEWQSYAKLLDSIKNSLELRAKVLQEYSDSPQLTIMQIDSDVSLIMSKLHSLLGVGKTIANQLREEYPELEEALGDRYREIMQAVEEIGPDLAREMYADLIGVSQRRARRMPQFLDVIEGETRLLESGNDS